MADSASVNLLARRRDRFAAPRGPKESIDAALIFFIGTYSLTSLDAPRLNWFRANKISINRSNGSPRGSWL
jgi:hypothetical protein